MGDVAAVIITQGLGGDASNMIVVHFHLGFFEIGIIVPPSPPWGGGGVGGPAPTAFPDRTEDWDQDAPRTIIVRVTFNKKKTEKIYIVSSKQLDVIIAVSNFLSKTRDRITVTITNVKRRMINVLAKFKNDNDNSK